MPRSLLSIALAALFLGALPAQVEDFKEDLKELRAAQKGRADGDQIHFSKKFADSWEQMDDKQKGQAQKAIAGNLRSRSQDVRVAAIDSLARMTGGKRGKFGAQGTKILAAEVKKKTTEENVGYFMKVVDGIGRIAHPSGLKTLEKLLKYKDYDVVGASARAMGHYYKGDTKLRKSVTEALLKTYTGLSNAAKDTRNNNAQERLGKVQSGAEASLARLTGEKIQGADAWWKWWNDSGKRAKEWPEPKG